MSRNKSRDTGPEIRVRSELHKRGFRFRKHLRDLPGKPDIVFPKAKVAVFIDGDFWHGYRLPAWENKLSMYWRTKIRETRIRDRKNHRKLRRMGWKVLRIWEHDVRHDIDKVVDKIVQLVNS